MSKLQTKFIEAAGVTMLWLWSAPRLPADTWALPRVSTNRSDNGVYELVVTPSGMLSRNASSSVPSAALRRKQDGTWTNLWRRKLVNDVAPVSAMVPDSGRYVVTYDEWHYVGKKPVVIYGENGGLIAELTLSDLKLENHPNISRSISSYWWNEKAVFIFGPPAAPGKESWRRLLEDSLFIRLYWGEVIAIDLASGKVRDEGWWKAHPAGETRALRQATDEYLDATWHRLAREYLRSENFEPDPTTKGVQGILLSGQLHLKEALPLLRKIAATERFRHWSAPRWKTGWKSNLRKLAEVAIAEIE